MDLIEMTAACYRSGAKLATFVQVHAASKEAYLLSIVEKPTKKDRIQLTKELETLRIFGEDMAVDCSLMAGEPKKEQKNVENTGKKD